MKKVLRILMLSIIPFLLLLSGCNTTKGFLGFLATTEYVDTRLQEAGEITEESIDASREESRSEIDVLRQDVDTLNEAKAELERLIEDIDETMQTTEELKQLAIDVETRLDTIPEETLRTLSDIISTYLEENF